MKYKLLIFSFLWLLLTACQTAPAPTAEPTIISLQIFQGQAPYSLQYPSNWSVLPLSERVRLFGEKQALEQQEPGVAVAVLSLDAENTVEDLDVALQHYLDNGPLAAGYETLREVRETSVDGRPARTITLTAPATDELPAMHAYILSTHTDNGSIYFFTATAPEAQWAENEAAVLVMLSSITFDE